MDRFIFILFIIFFAITPGLASAEIRKLSDADLKMVKAQSGIAETPDGSIIQSFIPLNSKSNFESGVVADISKSFDILVSDRTGSWERSGNSTYENGVVTLDETIHTKGIRYDNIRIKGAGEDAKTFGSIHIGEAMFQIKGQVKVTFRPD